MDAETLLILTMVGECEQLGKVLAGSSRVTRVGESRVWVPQLIEEGVHHGVNGGQSLSGSVLEQLGDQVDRIRICLTENL